MRPKHEALAFDGWHVFFDGGVKKVRVIPSPYRKKTHVAIPGGKPRMQELEIGREFFREKEAAGAKARTLASERVKMARRDLGHAEQLLQRALEIEGKTKSVAWTEADLAPQQIEARRIVCASIREGRTGFLICGARHGNCLQSPFRSGSAENYEQGFIDQFHIFLSREKAWEVASRQGQIVRRCGGDDGKLFSENLY